MISELLLQIVDPCCALNHQFDRIWNRRKVVPNMVNWPRCPLVPNWIREFRSWISVQRWLGNTIPTGCRSATAPMLRTAVMSSNWGMVALPVLCGNKKKRKVQSNIDFNDTTNAYLFLRDVIAQWFFDVGTFLSTDARMFWRCVVYEEIPCNRHDECYQCRHIECIRPAQAFNQYARQWPCLPKQWILYYWKFINSYELGIWPLTITVPNVPPNSADMNLPRSTVGAHFEMIQCNAGYSTPYRFEMTYKLSNVVLIKMPQKSFEITYTQNAGSHTNTIHSPHGNTSGKWYKSRENTTYSHWDTDNGSSTNPLRQHSARQRCEQITPEVCTQQHALLIAIP